MAIKPAQKSTGGVSETLDWHGGLRGPTPPSPLSFPERPSGPHRVIAEIRDKMY